MINCIYKDDSPKSTIIKLKSILNDLSIDIVERFFKIDIEGLYSIRITIKGTNIGTNGKGATPEYALASAYAEFIERLSNLILICPKNINNFFLVQSKSVFDYVNSPFLGEKKGDSLFLKKVNELFNEGLDKCLCYQLKNVISGEIITIPFYFSNFYGSNGMASGNSFFEMSVQAISEIFERYAITNILNHKAKAYIYDLEHIKSLFPSINGIICGLENKNLNVKIYDCSLNIGIPVFAVVVTNSCGDYSVSFGSHPNAEQAISRCFTEMFQGFDEILLKNNINDKPTLDYYNIRRILKNGLGVYPKEFLFEEEKSENTFLLTKEYNSNEEMYNSYISIIKSQKWELYYRDSSYLGFPSGQYYIPSVSDVFFPNELHVTFSENKKKYFHRFNDFLEMPYNDKKMFLELYDFFVNTFQSEKNICYTSNYSDDSIINLILYLYAISLLLKKYKKSEKYYKFINKKITDKSLLQEINKLDENKDEETIIKFINNGHFKRIIDGEEMSDELLKKLLKKYKEYYSK